MSSAPTKHLKKGPKNRAQHVSLTQDNQVGTGVGGWSRRSSGMVQFTHYTNIFLHANLGHSPVWGTTAHFHSTSRKWARSLFFGIITPKGLRTKSIFMPSFVIIYIITFTGTTYDFIQVTVQCYFISAWRTPFSISCRAGLLAKNSGFVSLGVSLFFLLFFSF